MLIGLNKIDSNGVVYYAPQQFLDAGGVRAAYSTKQGGVSSGCFESMNLGFKRGDSTGNVLENYRRICAAAGVQVPSLVFNTQVHGDTLIKIENKVQTMGLTMAQPKEADGFITNVPGVTLTCFYADCVPILLYDPVRRSAAAVHAGWRGTVADIAGKAVRALQSEYGSNPSDILASIGPCICVNHFAVGDEVADEFCEKFGDDYGAVSTEIHRKMHLDLSQSNAILLKQAGVSDGNITLAGLCTVCERSLFFSHRKSGEERGSHTAFISLEEGK